MPNNLNRRIYPKDDGRQRKIGREKWPLLWSTKRPARVASLLNTKDKRILISAERRRLVPYFKESNQLVKLTMGNRRSGFLTPHLRLHPYFLKYFKDKLKLLRSQNRFLKELTKFGSKGLFYKPKVPLKRTWFSL